MVLKTLGTSVRPEAIIAKGNAQNRGTKPERTGNEESPKQGSKSERERPRASKELT